MAAKLPSPKIFDPTAKRMPVFVWYTTRYPRVRVEYLPFCVRGKFSQLVRGNSGLMVVKGAGRQNFFQELGLFATALETLL
ncbi:hypothetical protein TNCV_4616981 [Trichonephila clavipes]|nr:hypothetical protein TNCV_4616981 [Trichonephila clavipes]